MPSLALVSGGLVTGTTTLSQARYAVIVDNEPVYQVANLLYDAGQLPDNGIFLYEITDSSEGSLDSFVRIVHTADFSAYPNDRVVAVAQGTSFYRSASWIANYSDLTVATISARDTKEKVNALVNEWINYLYEFEVGPPGDKYLLPTVDETVLSNLISNWQAARTAVTTAADELLTANTSVTSANSLLTLQESHRDDLVALNETLTQLADQSVQLSSFIESIQDAVAQLGAEPVPFPQPTGGTAFWADLNALINALGSIPTAAGARATFITTGIPKLESITSILEGGLTGAVAEYSDASTEVGSAAAAQASAVAAVTAAQQDLADAQRDAAAALATYNRAVDYEAELLTSLREVCPTFDVNNPFDSLGAI